MTKLLNFGLALMLVVVAGGCEWESSGDGGSWSDSYSWINFSGLYRGVNGPIVGNFTFAGGDDGTTPGTVVNGEAQGTGPAFQTILSGTLAKHPGITPGSVTIVMSATVANGSSGSVTDNGSGVLSGSVNLVGPDPTTSNPATGTINYDTGAWTLNLTSPGLLTTVSIKASYTYSAVVAETGGSDSDLATAGGNVNTILVEQVGNKLRFVDSNGNAYEGFLSVVSLAGGDSTGRSSGTVSATYEVKGAAGGKSVKITGSFAGAYLSPTDSGSEDEDSPAIYGQMTDRRLEGIWIQPDGTADVYGLAPQLTVEVQATTTTTE